MKSAAYGGQAGSTWAGKEGAGSLGGVDTPHPSQWLTAGVRAKPHVHRFPGDPRDKGDICDSIKLSGGQGVTSLSHSRPPSFLSWRLPGDTGLRSVPEKEVVSPARPCPGKGLCLAEVYRHLRTESMGGLASLDTGLT